LFNVPMKRHSFVVDETNSMFGDKATRYY
jgi:hypothetical protein